MHGERGCTGTMNSACVYVVQGPTPPSQGEQLLQEIAEFFYVGHVCRPSVGPFALTQLAQELADLLNHGTLLYVYNYAREVKPNVLHPRSSYGCSFQLSLSILNKMRAQNLLQLILAMLIQKPINIKYKFFVNKSI